MVKNTACLNTTSFCVFKCTIFNHATTVFNSQSRSKGIFKIIQFQFHIIQVAKEKELSR